MTEAKLNTEQQQEFVERLAEIARSGMPLSEGLRAAADESNSTRLSGQLRKMATRFETGADWEEVLSPNSSLVPAHIVGVIRAGIRSGNLSDALDSLSDQERAYRDIWRQLYSTLAYPFVLFVFTTGLMIFAMVSIVPPLEELFSDFGMELPESTERWFQMAEIFPKFIIYGTGAALLVMLAVRGFGGRSGWIRFMSSLPFFGPMIHFAGVAQMLRLLKIMLSHQMPLPDALRLTSSGVSNANMQRVSSWLANGVEAGSPLSDLMESTPRLPASIIPIVRWGERSGDLSTAMQNACDMLEGRIRLRGSLISVLVGPLMIIFLGIALGSLALAMFLPLISMTRWLS